MKLCPACSSEYPDERTHCERDGVGLVALTTGIGGRAEDLVGRTVDGRYLVDAIIGRGGMGTVYSCRHVVVGKPFAMKVLRPGVEQTGDVLQRFIREAQTANSVRSRHIVEMTDFGQLTSGQFYVTMELLEGMDLGKALKKGLTAAQMFHVFIQCAEVLELTHQRGIVHRDLKPDNIFLVREDNDPLFVKLLDFGIAKAMHSGPSGLTETGVVLGTPYYMSPEQARGAELDHRTDIYSLGVIMYRAFTGKLPFIADSAVGVLTRHLTETPELPSRVGGVEPLTERMILMCLEKRPADRFQSMAALSAALRAIATGQRPTFGVQDDPTSNDRGLPVDPALSGAMRGYGQDPRGAAQQRQLQSGGYPQAGAPQAQGPYGPPPALSASQQGAAVQGPYGAQQALSASQQGAAVRSPYGPPPALSASQQGPAAHNPYAPPPSLSASQQGAAAQGPYGPPPSLSASQQGHAAHNPYGPPPALSASQQGLPVSGAYPAPALSASQQGPAAAYTVPISAQSPLGAEWTAHGLAASQAMRVQQPRKKWPIIAGALAMLVVGAVLAVTLGGKSGAGSADGSAIGAANSPSTSSSATTMTAPTSAPSSTSSATAAPAPSDAPVASGAATTGASATAATGGSGPATKLTGAAPKPTATPKATASASATTTSTATKRPEIRSPFD